MGKVFGIAFLASIAGLIMGMALGSIFDEIRWENFKTDGRTGRHFVFVAFIVTGWGAGGIIGALAGVGHILQGRNLSKSPN
jgi:hypothetical protein